MSASVLNIAFYKFVGLEESTIPVLRQEIRSLAQDLRLKGTVILAPEGINGFLAGSETAIKEFCSGLSSMAIFGPIDLKESWSIEVPFKRLKIKVKREIIPMGLPQIKPAQWTGPRLEPEELKRWLDEGRPVVLVDTRNGYEISRGTFEGAIDPKINRFRDFPARLEDIAREAAGRPVVMFCTGGIRCEKATAVAIERGMKDVYQLEGGILRYFEKAGRSHFRGECFVFDEREALDSDLKPSDPDPLTKTG